MIRNASKFFKTICEKDWREKKEGVLRVTDNATTMEAIIRHIYAVPIDCLRDFKLSDEDAVVTRFELLLNLLEAIDFYDLQSFHKEVSNSLAIHMAATTPSRLSEVANILKESETERAYSTFLTHLQDDLEKIRAKRMETRSRLQFCKEGHLCVPDSLCRHGHLSTSAPPRSVIPDETTAEPFHHIDPAKMSGPVVYRPHPRRRKQEIPRDVLEFQNFPQILSPSMRSDRRSVLLPRSTKMSKRLYLFFHLTINLAGEENFKLS